MRKLEEKIGADPALRFQIEAFIKKATAEDARLDVAHAKLKSDITAQQHHLDAHRLVRELRDAFHFVDDEKLRVVVEQALADIPDEQLDDVALARLKCRHASLHLIKLIAALRGTLSAATEIALQNTFEKVLAAPINVQQGNQ
jgi:hypothetical protein